MRYELATNQQLMTIAQYDKDCTPSLLRGIAVEMMNRHLWDSLIVYAGRQAFINLNYTLSHILKISHKELIQIAQIEIIKQIERFKPGMRTLTSYLCMCLIAKFKKLKRDVKTEKRIANIDTKNVDALDVKIQERIFQSPINVEQYVINKITIEECWNVLRDIEKQAILMDMQGYTQYEIAETFGFKKTYGITLLKRAYKKLRRAMVA